MGSIERDRLEADRPFGQRLGATFPLADFFVDARRQQQVDAQIKRLVELLFEHPFHTPTRDENAMFHAQAAAVRSSAPGRQVGAVITSPEGDLIAAGTNEVPKPGGGQYWTEDDPDERDFRRADPDVSGTEKRVVVEQILRRLTEKGWLVEDRSTATAKEFYELLGGLRVQSLIEFERVVHAEMAAILDAARRGAPVKDAYLYTTTFPCHECTRHIIASGIGRLIYIEPYPKSLAPHLHDDAISIDEDNAPQHKLRFEPFVGVAPRQYLALFTARPEARKDSEGNVAAARPGPLPKGVPAAPVPTVPDTELLEEEHETEKLPAQAQNEDSGNATVAQTATDLDDKTLGSEAMNRVDTDPPVSEQQFVDLSDRLFIVREKNMLFELREALHSAKLEMKG